MFLATICTRAVPFTQDLASRQARHHDRSLNQKPASANPSRLASCYVLADLEVRHPSSLHVLPSVLPLRRSVFLQRRLRLHQVDLFLNLLPLFRTIHGTCPTLLSAELLLHHRHHRLQLHLQQRRRNLLQRFCTILPANARMSSASRRAKSSRSWPVRVMVSLSAVPMYQRISRTNPA